MNRLQLLTFAGEFIIILGNLITYAIIGRVLMSWFSAGKRGPNGRFAQALTDVTDPVINLAKKLPHKAGMMDFSPIIALLAVDLLVRLTVIGISKLA